MLILLSPAKNLDWTAPPAGLPRTQPRMAPDTKLLAAAAKRLKPGDVQRLMDLSDKLAALNHARFQAFDPEAPSEAGKQAALAFNGDVYQGLQAKTLSRADWDWAQAHLRILSGLYGLLRPLDSIQPYRLEMGVKLKTRRGADLYEFWGSRLAKALDAEAAPAIVNLASDEYFSAVDRGALETPVVSPTFVEVKDGKARPIFLYVKRARGLMARYAIERRIEDPEALKAFSVGGYRFDAAASDAARWVFARPQPPPLKAAGKSRGG